MTQDDSSLESIFGKDLGVIEDDYTDLNDAGVLLLVCLGQSAEPVRYGALHAKIYRLVKACFKNGIGLDPFTEPFWDDDFIDETLQILRDVGIVTVSDSEHPWECALTEYGRDLCRYVMIQDSLVHRLEAKGVL